MVTKTYPPSLVSRLVRLFAASAIVCFLFAALLEGLAVAYLRLSVLNPFLLVALLFALWGVYVAVIAIRLAQRDRRGYEMARRYFVVTTLGGRLDMGALDRLASPEIRQEFGIAPGEAIAGNRYVLPSGLAGLEKILSSAAIQAGALAPLILLMAVGSTLSMRYLPSPLQFIPFLLWALFLLDLVYALSFAALVAGLRGRKKWAYAATRRYVLLVTSQGRRDPVQLMARVDAPEVRESFGLGPAPSTTSGQ